MSLNEKKKTLNKTIYFVNLTIVSLFVDFIMNG